MSPWRSQRCEVQWPAVEEPPQWISIRRLPLGRRAKMHFTIVTPSYRQSESLRRCIASVADQDIEHEHIVHDACSDDGTLDWLPRDPRVIPVVAGDEGMYDAINRGFRRARGDVLAWLNSDEQYLPGALWRVWDFFERHPEVDMVLGDVLVTRPDGAWAGTRPALIPRWPHTRVGPSLSYLTAGAFIRRRAFEERELWFAPEMQRDGDREWTLRVIRSGVRIALLGEFTSVLTESPTSPPAQTQRDLTAFARQAPWWARLLRPAVVLHHHLRGLARASRVTLPVEYSLYTPDSPDQRRAFRTDAAVR